MLGVIVTVMVPFPTTLITHPKGRAAARTDAKPGAGSIAQLPVALVGAGDERRNQVDRDIHALTRLDLIWQWDGAGRAHRFTREDGDRIIFCPGTGTRVAQAPDFRKGLGGVHLRIVRDSDIDRRAGFSLVASLDGWGRAGFRAGGGSEGDRRAGLGRRHILGGGGREIVAVGGEANAACVRRASTVW